MVVGVCVSRRQGRAACCLSKNKKDILRCVRVVGVCVCLGCKVCKRAEGMRLCVGPLGLAEPRGSQGTQQEKHG